MTDTLRRSNVLQKIKVGDKITAALLNDIAKSVNGNAQNISSPYNKPRVFGEVARTSTTVSVPITSDDPILTIDPIEFEQIDTMTFRDSTGDIIHLIFNNPPTV